MKESKILDALGKKGIEAEDLADKVSRNPELLPEILDGVSSEEARVRFNSAKILRIISEKQPKILYSKIEFFVDLLDSENNILKWIAIDIIGNLASVDSENKFNRIFRKFYDLLSDESMITAGHVIDNSGKIAVAKPYLQDRITEKLLKVEKIEYKTSECRNILLGKVISSFDKYIDQFDNKKKMISLVRRQLKNSRKATRAKAEKFLNNQSKNQ
ncbi:MAG: hypothetical protein OEX06_06180 [Candidatus Bathyarchaeota archaeon]|nr:hypothetical protein [Candidatus Bathyarchaeota archaeon]MDH5702461.1 hypothetical protein [Candidatus Bathyarchaeota archaeon]